MKILFLPLLIGISVASISSEPAERLDRTALFDNCKKLAESKKSFRAYDRGAIRTFHLSSASYKGAGRENIGIILDEIERRNLHGDTRQVAYVLGTTFRETASTMRPVHEAMGCKTETCIHKNLGAYAQPKGNGKSYYGRGFSQLTHDYNYEKFGKLLGLQPETALYDNPDLALQTETAAAILIIGMFDGAFTDKYRLSQFFDGSKTDWIGARKIVSAKSPRAPVTAGYAMLFHECLTGQSHFDHGALIE
ncbi:glycoside hydrolase family 19 protein [Chitinimonas koreensis]|uniref:glycoside hydrolase family 19 protein n=1 Tax=Chitinimonas koreensis TaxID=356302 RepID=UPI0004109D1C|nr:glycoside hydrolase family 19 protein [Chitinimonas koreensis]QNM98639.1 hypothetical protein H9L41_10705 [Chitinimonas koreensis]